MRPAFEDFKAKALKKDEVKKSTIDLKLNLI